MLEWEPMILRGVVALAAVLAGVGVPGVAAAAAAGSEGQRVCKVTDDRLTELSGLAATGSGYVAIDDGSDDGSHRKIFYLDGRCKVDRTVAYPSRPRDTEDLGIAADGTLWVADIGDNDAKRATIALWRLAPGAKTPVLFRLAYPDGPHNAEALLLGADGTPVIVTKTIAAAGLYIPAGTLRAGKTTALKQAGSVALPMTTTSNPFDFAGRLVVTGGAVSPDGRHVVLRTYADAFEFEVPGGDLVKAITDGTPTPIAMPDEPQGESVCYTPDGTALLTVSEKSGGKPVEILRYALPDRAPATTSPATTSPATTSPATTSPAATKATTPPTTKTASQQAGDGVPLGLLATGGVLLLAAVVLGGVLLRRRS